MGSYSGSAGSRSSSPASTPSSPRSGTQTLPPSIPSSPSRSKPFRCPKPNCNKSYKRANGLKYHLSHGSCNLVLPKDIEYARDILERKRRERVANNISVDGLTHSASLNPALGCETSITKAAGEPFLQGLSAVYGDLSAITHTELREVEREANKRMRPFACGVDDCQRRYKDMNGLRHHYQRVGDHGAVGFVLLANGTHECQRNSEEGKENNTGIPSEARKGRRGAGGCGPCTVIQTTGSLTNLCTVYGELDAIAETERANLSPFALTIESPSEGQSQIPLDSVSHPQKEIERHYAFYTSASTSKLSPSLVYDSGTNTDSQALDLSGLVTKLGWILGNIEQYRQLLKCQGDEAQNLLNSFQSLLDMPQVDIVTRRNLVVATQRLSANTGLFPKCYELKNVELESNYRVKAGGSADVYRGKVEGQVVCLKVVRIFCDSDVNHFLKLVSKEAILWGQLDHRNVVPIYGLYRFENSLCFVSPWMETGDIVQYLKQNPGAPRRYLAMDVAQGLLYLHDIGIVHGDLKGANILINSGGIACIVDFGLSSISDPEIVAWTSQSSAASKGGTSRWQAPELFDVEMDEVVNNTVASDVYAWSCVCYEIFTGWIPFPTIRLDHTVVLQVMSGKRPSRPDESSLSWTAWGLTPTIWDLMEHCWKRNPDERPTMPDIIRRLSLELDEDVRSIADEPSFLSPAHFRQKLSHPMNDMIISAIIGNILNGP